MQDSSNSSTRARFFSFFPELRADDSPFDFLRRGPIAIKIGLFLVFLVVLGSVALGPKWGLDFTGGTELHIRISPATEVAEVRQAVVDAGFSKNQVQRFGTVGEGEWLIRVEQNGAITDDGIARIRAAVKTTFPESTTTVSTREGMNDEVRVEILTPRATAPRANVDTTINNVVDSEGDGTGDIVARDAADTGRLSVQAQISRREAQRQKIVDAVTTEAGLRLRSTTGGDLASVTVVDHEEDQTLFAVNLEGVSDDLSRELTSTLGGVEVLSVSFVDAQIAKSLKTDGAFALLLSVMMILIYVAVRFDIAFAPGAVFALFHDPVIAFSVFVFFNVPFDLPSVAAMLTIIGYSINNTIVIYDRIRETMGSREDAKMLSTENVKHVVNRAIHVTMNRTINTTLTTLMASVSLWVFTEGSVRNFALTITIGFIIGALSSVLIAPSVFVALHGRQRQPSVTVVRAEPRFSRDDKARGVV